MRKRLRALEAALAKLEDNQKEKKENEYNNWYNKQNIVQLINYSAGSLPDYFSSSWGETYSGSFLSRGISSE